MEQDNIKKLGEQIAKLESEKYDIIASKEEDAQALEEKEQKIKKLQAELDKANKKEQEAADILESLKKAKVSNIEQTTKDILSMQEYLKKEIRGIQFRYWLFMAGLMALFLFLAAIWGMYYCRLHDLLRASTEAKPYFVLLLLVPSMVIIGLMWGMLCQINSDKHHIISLKKFQNKYKVIEVSLKMFIKNSKNSDDIDKKITEVADKLLSEAIKEELTFREKQPKNMYKILTEMNKQLNTLTGSAKNIVDSTKI